MGGRMPRTMPRDTEGNKRNAMQFLHLTGDAAVKSAAKKETADDR